MMYTNPDHKKTISLSAHREVLSTLTHELRNPLTLVCGTLQLIESAHPEVLDFRHWDSLQGSLRHMTELLDDFSDYNNSFVLHKEPLDTSIFLGRFCLSFAAATDQHSTSFTSRIPPSLPVILADPVKLRQVLLNLLKNAFEAFSPDTAGSVSLCAECISSGGSAPALQIRIRDNGCGIPADRLEDIFTPFVTEKPNGTGLGLPVSRRIIEAHGGTLTASSEPDHGSTFTILLPTAPFACDTG